MKKFIKSTIVLTAVIAMLAVVPGEVKAEWRNNNTGWWWQEGAVCVTDSFKSINGKTYYFDEEGYMKTEWMLKDGNWYYFDSTGAMVTGWKEAAGKWFYFDADGVMAEETWKFVDGSWYYFDINGHMVFGWQYINGNWFYFNGSGAMVADNWVVSNNNWYYFGSNGAMQTGWQYINGVWYYFQGNGAMVAGNWLEDSGNWFYFNGSGAMATGWAVVGSNWYYFDGRGVMQTGWQYINGVWYYFQSNGAMMAGSWMEENGNWFYFSGSGAMATGWAVAGSNWYYFDGRGVMQTDWQYIGGNYYYFYGSGALACNTWIGNYRVDASGVWVETRFDYTGQLDVITKNYRRWRITQKYVGGGYAITDLDKNGRLEVVTSYVSGNGVFSTNEVWEVNEQLNGISLCPDSTHTDHDLDLYNVKESTVPAYYDPYGKQYYYIFEDNMFDRSSGAYTYKGSFTLSNGQVSSQRLAREFSPWNGADQYTNMNGAAISKSTFDNIGDIMYPNLQKKQLHIKWCDYKNCTYENLEESLNAFSIS